MNLLSIIGYLILALLFYLIIAPIPKLILLKIKYGNAISVYYFPFIGLLGQVVLDLIFKKDAFHSQKSYMKNNPKLQIHVSSDLKGGVHFTLVDPLLKRVVYAEQESFRKIEGLPFSDTYVDQGLLFQYGQQWSTARKMLTQHFTYEELKRMVGTLKDECLNLSVNDGPVDILGLTKILTSNAITKAFFGLENQLNNLGKEVNDNMDLMIQFLMNPLVLLRCFALKLNKESTPSFLLSSKEKQFLKVLKNQKAQIAKQIEERMKERRSNPKIEQNILTTLAQEIDNKTITMEQAIHQYFTLLIAGIDSTSHTLKNCCYALAKHQEAQSELRQEILKYIPSFDQLESSNLSKISYLDNFINEALRYYTPVPGLFNRIAQKDMYLGEFLIQKGQSVDVNFMITNFNPQIFDNPLKFNVNRWNQKLKDTYSFTPFSAGNRNCIGQHLALLELKTIIIYLILTYELTLNSGQIILGLGNMYGPTRKDFLVLKKIQ